MGRTILNADNYDNNRVEAITAKLEQSAYINKRQIVIHDYYFTTSKGLIAWVKLGKVLVDEIHARAIRAASKNFRTITYTPKLARDRRNSLDKILLEFKKNEPDFRYIIRNGNDDLKVLVKRISEMNHVPYWKYELHHLGALSPLKPTTPMAEEDRQEVAGPIDGFSSPKSSGRPGFLPKDEIFQRLQRFLNGFSPESQSKDLQSLCSVSENTKYSTQLIHKHIMVKLTS